MLIVEGSVCGVYWPIVSIVRPSRGERLSATTMRQIGFFFEPTRLSLIRTAIGAADYRFTPGMPGREAEDMPVGVSVFASLGAVRAGRRLRAGTSAGASASVRWPSL